MAYSEIELQNLIKDTLNSSLEDAKLSQDEKYEIQNLLRDQDDEFLNFARNSAFKLAQSTTSNSESFTPRSILKWLERTIKAIDAARPTLDQANKPRAYFSPGEAPKNAIIQSIKSASTSISICVFTISDNDISQALMNAHQQGIKVRILSDNDKSEDRGSDIDRMQSFGIPIIMDDTRHHMHHKFAIIDSKILINGSFNWTRSATMSNNENITLIEDKELVTDFVYEFEKLWQEWS